MSAPLPGHLAGRCLCGAVRFTLAAPPIAARACWCRTCQYLSSGNASIGAIFRRADLALTGETAEYTSPADSGTAVRRRFCPRCGTPLFAEAPNAPDLILVRAGTLDDAEAARPESTIWTGSAPSWGLIDPGVPRCEGQPS